MTVTRDAHRALVAKVLRVDNAALCDILNTFHARVRMTVDIQHRLGMLGEILAEHFPDAPVFNGEFAQTLCPACGSDRVRTRYRRKIGSGQDRSDDYTYGVCEVCGHGILLNGKADIAVYTSSVYYQTQDGGGVGYPAYEAEREYREAKGERLVLWAMGKAIEPPKSLLEVGSGFGFTRRSAERLGLRTSGIDLNPAAANAAQRLYGMDTVTGTLAYGVNTGSLSEGESDIVLYDFVLEHLADPQSELVQAARMLSLRGILVLRIPGMDALELIPFGSLYRSFRSDHLHLFSRKSLERMLNQAGLAITAFETGCGADLLRETLTEPELRSSYASGRGPDITVCTMRSPNAFPTRHNT